MSVERIPVPPKKKFPKLPLPIRLPFAPMEAERAEEIPVGERWQYEPKWDGFRALVFRYQDQVVIQSKSGQDLGRYFPELKEELLKIKADSFVLDGEIVLKINEKISFDDLQLRLHPAASRIERLSKETPATLLCFDLLFWGDFGKKDALLKKTLMERREQLERFFKKVPKKARIKLSPMSCDPKQAKEWFKNYGALGLDGVIAKDANEPYHSGDRKAMIKVKHLKSADCVVAGYRLKSDKKGVAALTLGLYDNEGRLNHVGSTSSFTVAEKKELLKIVKPLKGGSGFTGSSPGQSRWSKEDNGWIPLEPKLVCEVRYDYFTSGRFRHGTKFLRWRPDKAPKLCRYDQLGKTPTKVKKLPV